MIKIKIYRYFLFCLLLLAVILPIISLAQNYQPSTPFNPSNPRSNPYEGIFNGQPPSDPFAVQPRNFSLMPSSASTPVCNDTREIGDIICKIGLLINSVIPVLVALGVVYMVWGIVEYVIRDSEEAKKQGRDRIVFGLIGLTVILGLWGLVSIVINTFALDQSINFQNPTSFITDSTSSGGACSLPENNTKFPDILNYVTCIIGKSVIPLIFVLAIAMFIWGIVQYFILGGGQEEKRAQGRQFMIWGVVALAVMVSVWGLVSILGETFNIDTGFIPQVRSR